MSLTARHIDRIARIADLAHLAAALGHQARWEPVPARWSGSPTGQVGPEVWLVGQTAGKVDWLAVESGTPERTAGALARRAFRRGHPAVAFALDTDGRRLAVAAAFEGVPCAAVELHRPVGGDLLARLGADAALGPTAWLARLADALAAEPVGRRFFRQFRLVLDRMTAALPMAIRQEERHALALLQLTRVLFLYFVQAKGWLAGRSEFLAEAVDRCLRQRRHVHRDLLRPLFFGTLNRPAAERGSATRAFGAIPFLNGGLFEPHPLERRRRGDLPDAVWRDAFDSLFQRFRFTVAEGEASGSVAPDMLGCVFEGVMDSGHRRASGTFYTPAALVRRLVDAALAALVGRRLGCGDGEAARRLEAGEPGATEIALGATVLDPAVGSGAFLLGALERLATLRAGGGSGLARAKREILRRNLFGVDLNAAAVRLAELRLWLAVVADDPADRAELVEPLPNLDCLIRQGDSLADRLGPEPIAGAGGADAQSLRALRGRLVVASGAEKRPLVRALRAAERAALRRWLAASEAREREAIARRLADARAPDLFGERRGLRGGLRSEIAALRARLRTLRGERRRLDRDGELPWFHFQSHFADVFARGGFDLIIGNPPWVRAGELPAEHRTRLAERYRWWRSAGSGRGFAQRPDLAVAFVERSVELAAPDGVVALLVPAKVATAGYGTVARGALAAGTTLHAVADLTRDHDAGFDATVYPLALVLDRHPPAPTARVRAALAPDAPARTRQAALGPGPWLLLPDRERAALAELRADHPKLVDRFACHLGLKTGANDLFIEPPDDVEPHLVRWAVRGRDLRPFRLRRRVRLLWPCDRSGRPLERLPPRAAAYLAPHDGRLRRRADYAGGPPWTLFRAAPASATCRVVWADLARRLAAVPLPTADGGDPVPLNSCYVAVVRGGSEGAALAAWLNSTWIGVAARAEASPASGGFARFGGRVVGAVPLPAAAVADPDLAALAAAGATGENVQEDIDDLVARHLGLSDTARRSLRRMARRAGDRG